MRNDMNAKDRERTDRAWQKLYGRLDDEQLIDRAMPNEIHHPSRMVWLSVAASLLLICAVGTWWIGGNMANKNQMETLLTLENRENSTLVTTLQDGSIVLLSQDASITFPEKFESNHRLVDLSGNAFFDVAKDANAPFVIQTPAAVVKVLGTVFSIDDSKPNHFVLMVKEGLVEVESIDKKQKMKVAAGQQLAIDNGLFRLTAITDSAVFDVYTGHFRFKDQPLADIVRVVNQCKTANEKIELHDAEIGDICLTLEIEDYSASSFVELLTNAFGLKSDKIDNRYLLHR